jgi:hypothetical protein
MKRGFIADRDTQLEKPEFDIPKENKGSPIFRLILPMSSFANMQGVLFLTMKINSKCELNEGKVYRRGKFCLGLGNTIAE